MLFFSLATILLLICAIWFVLAALNQINDDDSQTLEDTNLSLYRIREDELKKELASGEILQQDYEDALKNYQRQLLSDTSTQESKPEIPVVNHRPKMLGIVLTLLIPVTAIGIYFFIGGGPIAMAWKTPSVAELSRSPQEMQALLEQKFDPESATAEEWYLLGRSYSLNSQFEKAQQAFSQSVQMEPENVAYLTDFIEASMLKNKGKPIDGIKPLILAGLERDENPKLLWLAAVVASHENNLTDQILYLKKLLLLMSLDDPSREQVTEILAKIESEQQNTPQNLPNSDAEVINTAEIAIRVLLDESLNDQITDHSTLFVFARAQQGPPMPLAVARFSWHERPETIVLNDTMAMMPNRKLSDFESIDVVAQISHNGDAKASSGDLRGTMNNVPVRKGQKIEITIDEIIE